MKILKKSFAVVLIVALALSICGCHKKGEIAIKIGDVEFTSAYYLCALVESDMSARQEIDSKAQNDDSIDTSKEGYYYDQKFDKKSFVDYVKDNAMDKLKELASYKSKALSVKAKISDEQQQTIDSYVDYYWTSYGYSAVYEPNGVSKDTFAEYMRDSYYADVYFDYLYAKDGKKAIADKDINKYRKTNYAVAEILTADLSTIEDDAQKDSTKQKFEAYYNDLKDGKAKFNEIYESYNNVTDENKQESYATLVGSDKTDYSNDNFKTIKAMESKEVKYIKNDKTLTIVVKGDLESDKDKKSQLDSTIRHDLKDDEFNKEMEKYQKTLKVSEDKSATKRFKIKELIYPTNNQ